MLYSYENVKHVFKRYQWDLGIVSLLFGNNLVSSASSGLLTHGGLLPLGFGADASGGKV